MNLKIFMLLFIVFSLFYFVFEAIINRLFVKDKVEKLLKKSKWAFIGHASVWMLPFGGISAVVINLMYQIPFIHHKIGFFPLIMFLGCIVITALELGGGMLLNKKLKLNIWDYSGSKIKLFGKEIPLHYKGQIDVWHSICWFAITLPMCLFSDLIIWLAR